MFLSSKTPYYPQQSYETYEPMPGHCKLVHINHMARHGSRHSTKLKGALAVYDVLADALRLGKLSPKGFEALSWTARFIEAETNRIGRLTHDGKVEHMETAERLWRAHGPSLLKALRKGRRVVFEATHKSRALGSQEAFLHGFADAALAVYPNSSSDAATLAGKQEVEGGVASASPAQSNENGTFADSEVAAAFQLHDADGLATILQSMSNKYFGIMNPDNSTDIIDDDDYEDDEDETELQGSHVHVVKPPECRSAGGSAEASHHYAKLRFFDTCAAYARYKKNKNWLERLEPYTANSTRPTSHENSFLKQLFHESHVQHLSEMGAARRDKKKPRSSKGVEGKKTAKAKGRAMPADIVADIYSICQIQANAYGILEEFCGLFQEHLNLMSKNELLYDLHDYYKQGAGDTTAFAMSCVLVEDFLGAGDEGAGLLDMTGGGKSQSSKRFTQVEKTTESVAFSVGRSKGFGKSQQRAARTSVLDISAAARKARRGEFAHFRFGHSETVMPFISMLGLYQEPLAPSLHDYYHSQLARGTSQLLNGTYARMHQLEEEANATQKDAKPAKTLQMGNTSFSSLHPRKRPVPFDADVMVALKHPWSGARLIPMAANIQWLLYDCGDYNDTMPLSVNGLWVKMLHNEREIQFPACTYGAHSASTVQPSPQQSSQFGEHNNGRNWFAEAYGLKYPCPWDVVKEYYRNVVYRQHGISTCDAEDWLKICGGVDMAACEQATDD